MGWVLVAVIALPAVAVSSGLGNDPWSGHGQTASVVLLGAALVIAPRFPALSTPRPFIMVWIAYLVAEIAMLGILDTSGLIDWTDRTPKYQWAAIATTLNACSPPSTERVDTRVRADPGRGELRWASVELSGVDNC